MIAVFARRVLTGSVTLAPHMAQRNAARDAQSEPEQSGTSPPLYGDDVGRILAEVDSLNAAGRYSHSLALLTRALERNQGETKLWLARGSTLYAWGRFWDAHRDFLRAANAGLVGPVLDTRLGWTCHLVGTSSDAEACMRRVVLAEPDSAESHVGLAVVLAAGKRFDEAIASYERALELAPDHKHALINLGICHLSQGNLDKAEVWLRRATTGHPRSAAAWLHLATALFRQDQAEAFAAYERAESLEAAGDVGVDTFINYGNALQNADRTMEALELYERNLPRRPHAIGYGHYSMALLASGRLSEGWNHYESRWFLDLLLPLRADFAQPVWSGQNLEGKTILLRAEQGIGDVIQFIRYAPLLKKLGATVLLQNRPGLDELMSGFSGIDRTLIPGEQLPHFDYYIHLMGLPRVFGTDLESIPDEVPYLRVDPDRAARWAEHLACDDILKVGLVWAGKPTHARDRYRSVVLQTLLPLLDVEGVRFFSLQKGPSAAQLGVLEAASKIVNLEPYLSDFAETAAAVSQLDLVISVDTSVAHLAGALGKPLWLLLSHPAEWRWLERREDSPWYPTATLFRQRTAGNWDDVAQRVKVSLQNEVSRMRNKAMEGSRDIPTSGTSRPLRLPRSMRPVRVAPGMCAVGETRYGIFLFPPDRDECCKSLGWYGEWLQPQLDLLSRLLRLDQTVMEVGAGVGAHAVPLGRAVGSSGHLILYEPAPFLRTILKQNLHANGLQNFTVMVRELSGPMKTETNMDPAVRSATTSELRRLQDQAPRTETLDELQLERLDWLKLNDPAITAEILAGGDETLWRLRPRMFIAVDRNTLPALVQRVRQFSYRCWRMETPLFNPSNFYRHDLDICSRRSKLAMLAIPEEIDVDVALDGCIEID